MLVLQALVAVQVTRLVPTSNRLPLAGTQPWSVPPVTAGGAKFTTTLLPQVFVVMEAGQTMATSGQPELASAKVCWADDPLKTPVKSPPAGSVLVLTATGISLCVVLLSPSMPNRLLPQDARVPSPHNAKVWRLPAAMATAILPCRGVPAVVTATGTRLWVGMPPLPSWPKAFAPQLAKLVELPSLYSTTLCNPPAAMATTVLPESKPVVSTSTGARLSTVLLLPSAPELLKPQAATVPS